MIKFLKFIGYGIFIICGALLVVFTLPRTGWKALAVATTSMTPAIPQGSLVLVHRVPNPSLKIGDVITYINPANTHQTITHRIVALKPQGNIPGFITKGDANQAADKPILGGNVIGRVSWHAPYLGRITEWLKTPLGLFIILGIPGLLIVYDEVRRLQRKLAEPEQQEDKPRATPAAAPIPQAQIIAASQSRPAATRRRNMDGIIRAIALLAFAGLTIHATQAQLVSNPVSLTNNRISTYLPANHIVIQAVFPGGGINSTACATPNTTINLGPTGPGSFNQIVITNNCTHSTTNTTTTTVTNTSSQTSTTGNSSNSGNTNGGSSTSGNASNNNSTTTTLTINNGGTTSSATAVIQLYNPTAAVVNLTNWTITDATGTLRTLAISIPAKGYVALTGPFARPLNGAGGQLKLRDVAATTVDAISWGTNTSILNPAIPAIPAGSFIARLAPGFDTDSASDWHLLP